MCDSDYDRYREQYYERYRERSTILRRPYGDKLQYTFWQRWLNEHFASEALILAVGCGLGFFLHRVARRFHAIGVDISERAVKEAQARLSKATVICASAQDLPFHEESFDVVIAFDVIEHLPHPDTFVSGARRVLKPGGLLVITTPNLDSIGAKLKGKRPDFVGRPYQERSLESHIWRTETHISLRYPNEWCACFEAGGFRVVKKGTDCLWDLPYTTRIPLALQKCILVPFNVVFQYFIGFLPWPWGENFVCIARKE